MSTIVPLRRVVAPGLTTGNSQLDRLVPLQYPVPHSQARVCLVGLVRKKGMLVCASELGDERRVSVDICVGCLNTSIFEVYL